MSVNANQSALAARDCLAESAREAGRLALAYFRPGAPTSARVETKAGGSPVTEADLAIDALLKTRLLQAFPESGWLSEESADDPDRLSRPSLLVVDPIDGTRAFVGGDPRWAVSIALMAGGRPMAAVVHAPALGETYAAARGAGSEMNRAPLCVSLPTDARRLSVAGPKSILQAMGAKLGVTLDIAPRVPSLAYRLSLAARGSIHFAVAAANSHDWDIAAADLLLEESGARLVDGEGRRLIYNRPLVARGPLLAAPDALAPRLLVAFRAAIGAPA